ncbi:hypothetical protein chiPu_0013962 [Chiloscyllium punctatum]|uniref:Uncharacterized protein n=1 Tax=Chiloscyllium punctatum TaxID=137246 RepID=A0A401SYK0_CHIPU|nr:hypothetical protein [Chiloscyllium punctatum]
MKRDRGREDTFLQLENASLLWNRCRLTPNLDIKLKQKQTSSELPTSCIITEWDLPFNREKRGSRITFAWLNPAGQDKEESCGYNNFMISPQYRRDDGVTEQFVQSL